ncbi:DegT/DnrJ/EryC1/StrS family aminotransferase [Virgibacillus soli]|uniref:DegT/DnrJ/EryC1/StrS family aminotransferase n=1 Tax=Paracerasibacillus soli TaxID=480284 RepID=A0ABU5CWY8_9BACI|nr:DegT/DnrJ/EryC1/StrS family aminotransferase [Virgibacillus soli]MDY0410354.1 DegT/DnrJ/EryC1/StrS family aminotransferase [Virgibacillus soli]
MIQISNPKRQFQQLENEILAKMKEVLQSGSYILGSYVTEVEKKIAKKIGVSEAIGVANGTDALVLTLEALGIGKGDEVITTPFTFFATAEAIANVGAKPVFSDIDETCNLDPLRIAEKITPRTKAIMPVHLFGQPANMMEINRLAKKYNLFVIEDACQAFGASYHDKKVGSLGDAACFSFFPTKNLSVMGDGGMVTTSNKKLAAKIRSLRAHGSTKKYYHDTIGYNSRLDEIHAVTLLTCLQHIDNWNEERRRLARRYNEKLRHLSYIKLPQIADSGDHVYHLFSIQVKHRAQLMEFMRKQSIQTGIYYPQPLHLQKVFHHLDYKTGDFPVAEKMSERLLAIPIYPHMTKAEQDHVITSLEKFAVMP